MNVSCSVPAGMETSTLLEHIKTLGLTPIVTSTVIRVVYEGDNVGIGEALIDMFSHECDHEITVDYRSTQEKREAKKASKSAWKAY